MENVPTVSISLQRSQGLLDQIRAIVKNNSLGDVVQKVTVEKQEAGKALIELERTVTELDSQLGDLVQQLHDLVGDGVDAEMGEIEE